MLGPIDSSRVECSQKTYKDGAAPVLVRLSNNMVFEVNKDKLIRDFVGTFAEVSGEIRVKDGFLKLKEVKALDPSAIPEGDPARKLLDTQTASTVVDL